MQANVANFTDLELIGSGGMGTVYRAFDPSLNRIVAVKMMSMPSASIEHRKRFVREAQAMSKLDHPNITKVLRVAQDESMQPYMVLEYVDGESLDKVLAREGKLHGERALRLFKELASALGSAHAQGIVHRDVKPANVLMTADGVAKLADFGIARDLMRITQATAPGTLLGSPMYASPEQCAGENVDARSDVYSLGCLMFEVLSGTTVFEGDDLFVVALKHQSEEPRQLSDVPAGLDRIVQRCLRKNREERFANGTELLKALELGDTTFQFSVAAPTKKAPKPVSTKAMILASVVLCCALVGYVVLNSHPSTTSESSEAFTAETAKAALESAKRKTGEERRKALLESEHQFTVLSHQTGTSTQAENAYSLGHVHVELKNYEAAVKDFDRAIKLEKRFNVEAPVDSDYYYSLGACYVELQRYVEAEKPLKQAIRAGARKELFFCYFSDFWIGYAEELKGEYKEAMKYYRRLLSLAQSPGTETLRERTKEHIAIILKARPDLAQE